MLMKTRPFTEAHAISSFELACIFGAPATAEQLASIADQLRPNLGAEFGSVVFHDGAVICRPQQIGQVSHEVYVDEYCVRFIYFDYRGWQMTRRQTSRLMSVFLPVTRQWNRSVASCGVACVDTFVRDEGEEGYSVTDVFDPASSYLPRWVARSGPKWKLRSTWNESIFQGQEVCSRLDIEAKVHVDKGQGSHVTEIDHKIQTVGPAPGAPFPLNDSAIVERFDWLHATNKRVVRDLLSSQMAFRVGLEEMK